MSFLLFIYFFFSFLSYLPKASWHRSFCILPIFSERPSSSSFNWKSRWKCKIFGLLYKFIWLQAKRNFHSHKALAARDGLYLHSKNSREISEISFLFFRFFLYHFWDLRSFFIEDISSIYFRRMDIVGKKKQQK